MARGTITILRDSELGTFGYVADDDIPDQMFAVRFDCRHLADTSTLSVGMRVSWTYNLSDREHRPPWMKFDSMKPIA